MDERKRTSKMNVIDLSDIYDSCYSGYDDYTAELTLERGADSETWRNDSVKFYNTAYGWAYEESSGQWNYGYDSLKEAVTKYTGALAAESAEGDYIASRIFKKQYDYKFNPKTSEGHICCVVIKRMFKGECDYERTRHVNNAISHAINKLAS